MQDKISNSESTHKGVTEFLGWRDAGEPNSLTSYKMVQRREETENREEEENQIDKEPRMAHNSVKTGRPLTGHEAPANRETQACKVENEINDNHVLEGVLPKLGEGWKWVKQIEIVTEPRDVAEAMVKQYFGKNQEVRTAIGQPNGDYLERVRRMTAGNCSTFKIEKVTEKQVMKIIRKVDNKGSFGVDLISYKDIKLLEKYVANPLIELINLSIETRYYPSRWKTARVKPLWKGEGNDRKIPKSYKYPF